MAKPRHRWRAPTKIVARKRDPLGAPVDGRRSGSNKPPPLTRERGKRSSVLRAEPGPRTEPSAGCDRERQRSFANVARGRQRRGEVAPLIERSPSTRAPQKCEGRGEWSKGPKLGTAPSSALYLGLGRRKAGRRRSRQRASARMVAAVGEVQASRSGITRSTGARVVSRLQKSARSIFLARSRGAERQTEKARGNTSRRFLP